jgi:hypothetical protein
MNVVPTFAALTFSCALAAGCSGSSGGISSATDASTDGNKPLDAAGDVVTPGDASSDAGSGDGAPKGDSAAPASDGAAGDAAPGDAAMGDSTPGDSAAGDAAAADSAAGDAATSEASPPCAATGFSGALVTYDLTGQPGDETSAPAASSATGVTPGDLSRAAALMAASGTGSINSSGWPTTASADATKYYTFTVTPAAGCTLALTSLALDVEASSKGPTSGDVATSADAFATHVGTFTGTSMTTAMLSDASGSGAIEIRVYGYAAAADDGTFRIKNTLTLTGSIQ